MSAELNFWIYFLGVNVLFFLPRYLLEWRESSFVPYKGFLEGPISERVRYLINRYNYDIFRVSVDWLVLAGLLVWLQPNSGLEVWHGGYFVVVVVLWAYQVYYHVMERIYQIEPVFYSDRLLLQTGFQLFVKNLKGTNLLIIAGVLGVLGVLWWLIGQVIEVAAVAEWSGGTYLLLGSFGFLGLYSLVTYNYKAFGKIAFPSQTQSIYRNIRQSLRTSAYFKHFDFEALSQHRPYEGLQLKERPNIYFLVVESYGKIALEDLAFSEPITQKLSLMAQQLKAKDWHSASSLSEAPITGGASWISYTSALFGLPIRDQAAYLTLLHHPAMRNYQHLMRWLQTQGYRNYRLSPIAGFEDMSIPWDDYQDFYAIDEWIKFKSFGYQGPLYGFGPCPPDQYSLHFAHDYMKQQAEPHFLFFITQNSHSPFTGPAEVLENYKDWIDPTATMDTADSASIFSKPQKADYLEAILYQLDFIHHFIEQQGKANDLFILMGDHQPPVFPGPRAGFQTPVHVIGKHLPWVEAFKGYGFSEGMLMPLDKDGLRHEALFSLVVRSLMEAYGEAGLSLPEVLANGIDFGNSNNGRN
ncbi:MAG: sulfatase-like hydrolase/transferase [Bacteroidota bacterium]